eukprot:gene32218-16776_t
MSALSLSTVPKLTRAIGPEYGVSLSWSALLVASRDLRKPQACVREVKMWAPAYVGTADGGRSVVRPAQQQVDSLPHELSSGLTTPDSDEPASSPMKKFEKVGRDPVEFGRRAKLAADLLEQAAAETPLPAGPFWLHLKRHGMVAFKLASSTPVP